MTPLLLFLTASTVASVHTRAAPPTKHRGRTVVDSRNVFSPRMDYDEWTPLIAGRGDPLKNDPTYDYVPPVLERVHYWMDPSKRTPDPPLPNSKVMVLGARTEPPVTTDTASSRFGTMTLLDPFLKFMDASKSSITNTVSSYFTTPDSTPYFPSTNYPSSYGPPPTTYPASYEMSSSYLPIPTTHATDFVPPPAPPKIEALQRPPYTMLMPPPPPSTSPTEPPITLFATTMGTTSEASEPLQITTTPNDSIAAITELTSEATTTSATQTYSLANAENLYKPVAINMPELMSNETNEKEQHFLPTPSPEVLPIVSMFQGNHINYEEPKLPSLIMVPPPKKTGDYYSFRSTTVRPITTVRTLTTDPMFKHYKQPSEPIRGPFYLIIQGHSKVKTYGASKNKVKAVSSNEINYEDGRSKDNYDMDSEESHRQERKLKFNGFNHATIDENEAEVIEGHPTIELSSSFRTKGQTSFSVGNNFEESFPESHGGNSKKRFLVASNETLREKRFIPRRLLAATTEGTGKPEDILDQQQLGLESLIGLNEDYNSDDVINLLLKEEGEGSGLGNFVSSLFARSLNTSDEM